MTQRYHFEGYYGSASNEELKKCPFCGSEASLYEDYTGFWLVQCKGCGIGTIHRKQQWRVIKEWNRRIEHDS